MTEEAGDRVRGWAGKVEEVAGQATGNENWVAEGKREQDAARERPEKATGEDRQR
jgi:uncharacterized protein YjbJ (UPF0337 family)